MSTTNKGKEYKDITLEEIEKAVKEIMGKVEEPKERRIKIITWQGGYDLFCKAMKEQFELKHKK